MQSQQIQKEKVKWKEITWEFSPKQLEAFDILQDDETTELFFGGGAGGGKSRLGSSWIIFSCLKYPGIRCLMGRAVLKSLKDSTLLTFFQVCKEWGLKKDIHFKYSSQASVITFFNGSAVYLKDLFAYPSDPEFDNLGSTEYTHGFIDEGSQVTVKAKNILFSRLRYRLDEFKLIPKLLIASNPCKHWAYYDFYKPSKEGTLQKDRKFIIALAKDCPWTSKYYIENLKKLDKASKERLLYGNWEYEDDPSRLFEYDDILDLFTNTVEKSEDKYLTVDVARFGTDRTVIIYWEGLEAKKVWYYTKKSTKETEELIREKAQQYQIKMSGIIVDEDGIGGGIVDHMPQIKGFVNNSKALDTFRRYDQATMNYANLKSQCYFYLAEIVRLGKVAIKNVNALIKNEIIEELEQIKRKDPDKDGRLQVIGKEEIREHIGRSTDFADAIMMRIFFELRAKHKPQLHFTRMPKEEIMEEKKPLDTDYLRKL
jgi:phage terminase large subunit